MKATVRDNQGMTHVYGNVKNWACWDRYYRLQMYDNIQVYFPMYNVIYFEIDNKEEVKE